MSITDHCFIDVTFDRWWALMEVSMEKCFEFSSFVGNLIDMVIPVKMVVNRYIFRTSNFTNYIIID